MKQILVVLGVLTFGIVGQSQAAEMLHVKKMVEINASADKVWEKVADFGDLGAWHPAVKKTEIVEGEDNKVGAKRLLTLQDDGKINETLTAYKPKAKSMTYIITESVLPVEKYSATIKVKAAGKAKSIVTWEAHFLAKAPADNKTAVDTINGVFDGGLSNLKKIEEAM